MKTSECLRENHQLRTVGDAEMAAAGLNDPDHVADPNCLCESCIIAGDGKGCNHPHFCFVRAQKLLDTLPPKWDPRKEVTRGECDEENEGQEGAIVSRCTSVVRTLADMFRVFTEGNTVNEVYEAPLL